MAKTSRLRRLTSALRAPVAARALLLATLALSGCEDLATLKANECGNGIIEAGEDCDGVGIGTSACNALCRLECTAEGACPSGYGCGSDGLCRQPSGQFEAFGPALGLSAEKLSLADFDGDGQADLLASRGSSFSVAYVGPQGLLPETTNISYAPIDTYADVPSVLDIDGDGRADLASRLGPSVGVLRGQQNRTLLPLPFARTILDLKPEDVLLLADVDTIDSPGPELLAVRQDGLYLVYAKKPGIGMLPKKVLSFPPGKKPRVVSVGQSLGEGAGTLLALSVDGEPKIRLYSLFVIQQDPVTSETKIELNEDAGLVPLVDVTLPAGAVVKGPVWAGEIWNQSVGNDLVIAGTKGGEDKLFVAFRAGNGFDSKPQGGLGDSLAHEIVRFVDGVPSTKVPLAVGYLGNDDVIDYVDPDGIHLHGCQVEPEIVCPLKWDPALPDAPIATAYVTVASPETTAGWTGAAVVAGSDVFETSFGQVITTSAEPGFTFFKRAPGNALNPFRVQTQSAVLHPAVGDFNGDGSPDLVFSQISTRASAKDPTLESLHVAFGDAFGIPRDLSDLGDVGKVDSIFTARIVDAVTSGGVSGLSDALVRSVAKDVAEYYLFAGSTDGTLQSALSLTGQCTGAKSPKGIPRFLTLARAGEGKGARLSALFRDEKAGAVYGYRLWSAALSVDGGADVCESLIGPEEIDVPSGGDVAMAAVDLDGDGADETLILPKGKGGAGSLVVAKESASGWTVSKVALSDAGTGLYLLNLGRTTADGKALVDVGVLTAKGVTVLWNEGTGALSGTAATSVAIEGVACESRKGAKATSPRGVAALGGSPAGRALGIVTDEDTFAVVLEDAAGKKFGAPICQSRAFGGGGGAVTAGDINADGVDDLVIARPGGTQIFTGIPVVR